jgi:transposase
LPNWSLSYLTYRKGPLVANRLRMATADSILRLHAAGWSQRRIARELQVSRDAVARYVGLAQGPPASDSKPAKAPLGSLADPLPASHAPALPVAAWPTAVGPPCWHVL